MIPVLLASTFSLAVCMTSNPVPTCLQRQVDHHMRALGSERPTQVRILSESEWDDKPNRNAYVSILLPGVCTITIKQSKILNEHVIAHEACHCALDFEQLQSGRISERRLMLIQERADKCADWLREYNSVDRLEEYLDRELGTWGSEDKIKRLEER